MKIFYQLTPVAFEACVKIDQALDLISAASDIIEIDMVNVDDQLDQSDIFYLFKEYHDQEFCDQDNHKNRTINFYQLEQSGLIQETFRKDPCQI